MPRHGAMTTVHGPPHFLPMAMTIPMGVAGMRVGVVSPAVVSAVVTRNVRRRKESNTGRNAFRVSSDSVSGNH